VSGNLKYDLDPRPSGLAETLRPLLGRRPSVVAGSVLAGEEEMVLQAWREVLERVPQAVLVLAPRHPERFGDVARQVGAAFRLVKASEVGAQGGPGRLEPRTVVLLDTVGDLAAVYGLGDVAFVGGSLVRKGGHNPLEPARFGVPVVMGPSFENFREIVENLEAENGIRIVQDVRSLRDTLSHLLMDPVAADALGQRGLQVFVQKAGATARTVGAVLAMLPAADGPREGAGAGVRA
jgi:3-deoxy-D-manno-octulosonic-acid transferase